MHSIVLHLCTLGSDKLTSRNGSNVIAKTACKCASLSDECPGYSPSPLCYRRARNNHGIIWAACFSHTYHCSASSIDSIYTSLQWGIPYFSFHPPLGWEHLLLVSKVSSYPGTQTIGSFLFLFPKVIVYLDSLLAAPILSRKSLNLASIL